VAEVGLVEVACATGEVAPVDRSGGVDRELSPIATARAPTTSPRPVRQVRYLLEPESETA